MRNEAPNLFLPGVLFLAGAFFLLWLAFAWVTAVLMFVGGWIDIFHPHWYETAIPSVSGLVVASLGIRFVIRRVGADCRVGRNLR